MKQCSWMTWKLIQLVMPQLPGTNHISLYLSPLLHHLGAIPVLLKHAGKTVLETEVLLFSHRTEQIKRRQCSPILQWDCATPASRDSMTVTSPFSVGSISWHRLCLGYPKFKQFLGHCRAQPSWMKLHWFLCKKQLCQELSSFVPTHLSWQHSVLVWVAPP